MAGWIWLIIGIALCIAEMVVVSGFFLFLLGVSALLLGLLVLSGLLQTWPLQAVVFSVLAIASWILFGSRLKGALSRSNEASSDDTKGKVVQADGAIPPGHVGSGELWGSTWRLKNVGDEVIPSGAECVVVDVEGVTLHVTRGA